MNKKKALLIGSRDESWEKLEEELVRLDYSVIKVSDGFDAYRVVEKEIPSFILIEVVPPKIVGFSICKLVKIRPMLSHIPVIVTVVNVDANLENLASKSGADAIIPYSTDPQAMLAELKKHTAV
ncbi:MAG: hypothetical protein LWY06_04130 [Firmicutes bacterium]|nr:hypothetical protein [Bacillota bacterium]